MSNFIVISGLGSELIVSGGLGNSSGVAPTPVVATSFKTIFKIQDQIVQAILLSVFIRKRKNLSDGASNIPSRNGSWFDAVDSIFYGSSIWELETEALTDNTLFLYQTYVEESLQWMLDEIIISDLIVLTERKTTNILACSIQFNKPDGSSVEITFLWDKLKSEILNINTGVN